MKEGMLRLPLKAVPASSAKADNAKGGSAAHLTEARKAIGAK
jgi:hypothetical protein